MNYELPSIELRVIEENNYLKFGEYLKDMPCGNTINKLSLDDLQYVKKLQQKNKQLQERVEYLERSNDRREDTILDQRQEISDLEDNWNKLKEYCADSLYFYDGYQREDLETDISIQGILNKMQELESSDSNVKG